MGRAGSGGGGGSHSSGGHSSSRSSGGHSMGSSRPSSSGFNNSCRGSSTSRGGWDLSPYPRHYYRGTYYNPGGTTVVYNNGYYGRSYRSPFWSVAALIIIVIAVFIALFPSNGNIPASTQNRTKISTGVAYQNDCVVDEIGWVENTSKLEKNLQEFYNKTGVQPYIYLKAYDSSLVTEADKTAYAEKWYDANIDNEGTFLFMYFGEQDVDNDVGYMAYVNGKQVTAVMDAEAVDIFWAYVDTYWYSDKTTTDMFTSIFNDTADRIMDKSTTGADVGKAVAVSAGVLVAGIVVIVLVRMKHKRAKEENEETVKILNTPLDKSDDLADKYTK